jgi:hypothetical protein
MQTRTIQNCFVCAIGMVSNGAKRACSGGCAINESALGKTLMAHRLAPIRIYPIGANGALARIPPLTTENASNKRLYLKAV